MVFTPFYKEATTMDRSRIARFLKIELESWKIVNEFNIMLGAKSYSIRDHNSSQVDEVKSQREELNCKCQNSCLH